MSASSQCVAVAACGKKSSGAPGCSAGPQNGPSAGAAPVPGSSESASPPVSTATVNNNTQPPPSQSASPPVNNAPKYGTLVPNRVFVGGISANTTEGELAQLFSAYGTVKATKIISDRAGVSKGYGFVTFESEEEAKRLQREADNIMLRERRLNIAPAIKKQPFNRSFDVASPPPAVASVSAAAAATQAAQFYYSAAAAAAAAASPYAAYQNGCIMSSPGMAYYATPPPQSASGSAGGAAAAGDSGQSPYQPAPPPTAVYATPATAPQHSAPASAPPPYHHMPPYAMPQPLFMPHQYNPYQPIPYETQQYYGGGGGGGGGNGGGGSPGRVYHPACLPASAAHNPASMYQEAPLYYNVPVYALDHHLYSAAASAPGDVMQPPPHAAPDQPPPPPSHMLEGEIHNHAYNGLGRCSPAVSAAHEVKSSGAHTPTPVVSLLNVGAAHERDLRSMQGGRKHHQGIQSFRINHNGYHQHHNTTTYHRSTSTTTSTTTGNNNNKCDVTQCRNTWSKKRRNYNNTHQGYSTYPTYTFNNTGTGNESSSRSSVRTSSNSSANAAVFDENLNEKSPMSVLQHAAPVFFPAAAAAPARRNRRHNQRNRHHNQAQHNHRQEVGAGDAPPLSADDTDAGSVTSPVAVAPLCTKMDAIKL